MTEHTPNAAILDDLNEAAAEYDQAKRAFNKAKINFEVAKRRLEVTGQVAGEAMPPSDLREWFRKNWHIRFAGMTIGDAIAERLRESTYNSFQTCEDPSEIEEYIPVVNIDQLQEELAKGGFEFRTPTPLRELNAALMNHRGVKKSEDGNYYYLADVEEIRSEVFRQSSQVERGGRPVKQEED